MNEFHGNCQKCQVWTKVAFNGSMGLSELLCSLCRMTQATK